MEAMAMRETLMTMKCTIKKKRLDVPPEEKCMEIFEHLDVEQKGSLSMTQLSAAAVEVWGHGGFNNDETTILKAVKVADINSNGDVDRNEFELFLRFIAFYKNNYDIICGGSNSPVCIGNYDEDNDHDSRISKERFVAISPKLKIGNADLLFCDIDRKNRGYLKFDDFCKYMAINQCSKRYKNSPGCFRFSSSSSSKLLAIARLGRENNIITQCILDLRCCIDILNGNATDEELEHIGCVVHECLSGDHRFLRNIHRTFKINNCADPYQTISSFFMDIVLYEADGGLSKTLKGILAGVMDDDDEYCISKLMTRDNDLKISLVMGMFGYQPGERLSPRSGMNKFLSACVASRMLKDILPLSKLARILICIVSCNPYKKPKLEIPTLPKKNKIDTDANHTNPLELTPENYLNAKTVVVSDQEEAMEICFQKLLVVNESFQLGLSDSKLVKAVQRGTDLINRTFGVSFVADFECHMHDTWQLLPELTPALREAKLYTIFDYHMGLQNLELQWRVMDPCRLFHTFRGVPNEQEMAHINRTAKNNVRLLRIYLHAIIVSLSTVASFAILTGGDAPISFFLGDQPNSTTCPTGHGSARIGRSERHSSDQLGEDFPIIPPENLTVDFDRTVYNILLNCRPRLNDKFALEKSPMTALIYGRIGTVGVGKALKYAEHPMEKDRAMLLLKSLPKDVVFLIGKDIARIAVSRTSLIEKILVEIGTDND